MPWLQKNLAQEDTRLTIEALRSDIEIRLQALLETDEYSPPQLLAAMRHALLGGGKRIRPILFVLTTRQRNNLAATIDIGCAIEMVHTASLILDDLPCMDDADLRRDKPTTHKVFGQSTAILAAISLLTRGMNIVSTAEGVPADVRSRLVAILSHAVGHTGLAAGQEVDLSDASGQTVEVEQKNWLKTGKLFAAMAEMAALLDARPSDQATALAEFAFHLGSAFQALDDLLDAISAPAVLGKNTGKDGGKSSMVNDRGAGATRLAYMSHLDAANLALSRCGVDEEPIRLMLHSIHRLVPQEPETA
ncbi:polyprenyl synthetase family protein [Rhizobium sp. SSA_523]|uniref:polyprenyl synthetase family protein n=1 Tax=Rhizobium sp. SSA_523 TaxID=2952477 RepID=UPI002090D778|nr:polyprenyl synthetase family protein [Rhizobium sp. SSA_523]MCO5734755.1 polyprenyl synthetase family protein [Rhizobium sp. SSA_523]WKC22994.1 polyprenyl synthetase family protein [Rhizobium sp. SSA_523]